MDPSIDRMHQMQIRFDPKNENNSKRLLNKSLMIKVSNWIFNNEFKNHFTEML